MAEREWVVQLDDPEAISRLRLALNFFDYQDRRAAMGDNAIYHLVCRPDGLKIEVFSDEHPPPHFRVSDRDEVANYRISDWLQLNGGLRRYHWVIQDWPAENKTRLIEAWNKSRPTDCPVGEYRES